MSAPWIAWVVPLMAMCLAAPLQSQESDTETQASSAQASSAQASALPRVDNPTLDFQRDVAPILRERCLECHNAELQMGGLRLDSHDAIRGAEVLEPGSADDSLLYLRTHKGDLGLLMPPTGKLSPTNQETLRRWIDEGAHWPADVKLTASDRSPVDALTTALLAVIRAGDLHTTRQLIKASDKLIHRTNVRGATPLHQAAMYAGPELVGWLTEQGADVHATDDDGMTPLMLAVADSRKVKLLLDHGAKAKVKTNLGRPALLMAAAYAGNSESVHLLLDAGADVNFHDARDWTALVLAARTGDKAMVRSLIRAGADVLGGNSGRRATGSPLMQSAWACDVEVAEVLLAHGAAQDQRSLDTSLIFAATHGDLTLTRRLLEAGANPHAKVVTNYVPESPILAAAYSDALPSGIVEALLDHRVDVSIADKRGETPLSLARQRGPSDVLRLLTEAAKSGVSPSELVVTPKNHSSSAEAEQSTAPTNFPANEEIRRIVQANVDLLQSCGGKFFAKSGCVACHQQTATSLVVAKARHAGFSVDEQTEQQQIKLTSIDLQRNANLFRQRMKVGGASHRIGYLLWGLSVAGYPPDEITDAAHLELAGLQLHDGRWVSDGHRPPTEYSPITATAVAVRAISAYAPPGQFRHTQQRIRRATAWLSECDASANAEKAFRLLGLHWGGAGEDVMAAGTDELLNDQDPSGGWSQLPSMPPDAYATGLTLYALHTAGDLSVTHEAYRRGVQFLMRLREADNTWHVPSRSFGFQPYFESGFPHGHDQWISAAATSWACLALMEVCESNGETRQSADRSDAP